MTPRQPSRFWKHLWLALAFLLAAATVAWPRPADAQRMLVGNDEKITRDEAGKPVMMAPGKDTVSIVDIGTTPEAPRIIVTLPLMNTIFGPPTNLAITPDERLAIVANSVTYVPERR